ncbi:MAG: hypothetical protein HYU36_24255 [Planctomycetes bacterium]|nr:hypothetical protein [Planctomycetota bacterium]
MTARERFLATASFEKLDRPLYWECAFWTETVDRWRQEGLPDARKSVTDLPPNYRIPLCVEEYFGFDSYYLDIPVETRHLWPPFEEEVLEDHGDWVLRRNRDGAVEKAPKGFTGMRAIAGGGIQSRMDWQRIKAERIQPALEGRVPDDFDSIINSCADSDRPVRGLMCEHWLNLIELFGPSDLLCLLLDDPAWVKEMLGDLTEFFIGISEQVLRRAVPDLAILGGDFCYKNGPLMSPAAFSEFLLPEFRKVADLFRSYGVAVIMMHTDGDCRPLIPLFLEAGANGVHPFEVTNGQTIVEVREAYPDLLIFGGMDKKAVAAGKSAIDRELESKLPFMLRHGGYFPYLDHAVDPAISFDNFVYYRGKLNEIVERAYRTGTG